MGWVRILLDKNILQGLPLGTGLLLHHVIGYVQYVDVWTLPVEPPVFRYILLSYNSSYCFRTVFIRRSIMLYILKKLNYIFFIIKKVNWTTSNVVCFICLSVNTVIFLVEYTFSPLNATYLLLTKCCKTEFETGRFWRFEPTTESCIDVFTISKIVS